MTQNGFYATMTMWSNHASAAVREAFDSFDFCAPSALNGNDGKRAALIFCTKISNETADFNAGEPCPSFTRANVQATADDSYRGIGNRAPDVRPTPRQEVFYSFGVRHIAEHPNDKDLLTIVTRRAWLNHLIGFTVRNVG